MSGFTVDTSQLNQMGAFLGALDSEINTASVKSANQTATWLRRTFVDEVAKLGPPKKLVRDMTRINRAKRGRPVAEVRPSGFRLYADSFTDKIISQAGASTRGRVKISSFGQVDTAIGFVNPKAKKGEPQTLRTRSSKGKLKKLEPGLGPSPAMLFYDFFASKTDLENEIYEYLISQFETNLTEAMDNR